MRYLLLLTASVSLSACSIFEQPGIFHSGYDAVSSGQYAQGAGCVSYNPCGTAGGYSVASAPSYQHSTQQNVIAAPAGYSPTSSMHIGSGQAVTFGSNAGCAQPCTPSYSQNYNQNYNQGYAQDYTHEHAVQYAGHQHGGGYPADYSMGQTGYHQPSFGMPRLRGLSNGYTYGNLGGVIYDVDRANYGLLGRVGYAFSPYLAAEVEGSLNLKNQDISISDGTNTLSGSAGVDYNVAAFALARLPITKAISVHARGGYDVREFGAEITDGTTTASDTVKLDGFAYGVGAQFDVNPRDAIRLDYTRYENDLTDFDSVAATYVRKF